MLPNLWNQLGPYLDPFIRIMITAAALIGVAFVLSLGNTARLPLRIMRIRLPATAGGRVRHPSRWSKHLLLVSRAIQESTTSDEERIRRFILYTMGSFVSAYLLIGMWTGAVDFNHLNGAGLTDRWLLMVSFWSAALPYGILRLRLHSIRVKNSEELIPAVNTLLFKYREYHGNLYYAVFETVKELKGGIRTAFAAMLPALQGASGATIEEAIDLFIFRVRSQWAMQLGILFQKSEQQGDNIERGLRWLITDMSEVTKISEELKTENREAIQMGYLPAILLPLVVFLNQYPSMGKSWFYYFHHPAGIRMLVFTILFTLFCGIAAFIIQKPRNEM
ncbi:type II secretion system F family protein [Gorillibacterium massiliense]|uniref:type II secretion system F family protein n=1 Tax=Gorillibacterium massiliense TaxID=1280390 RepID=UPI0004BA6EDC|nr:hypothetical protein [Gorillibacterium massiliense]